MFLQTILLGFNVVISVGRDPERVGSIDDNYCNARCSHPVYSMVFYLHHSTG